MRHLILAEDSLSQDALALGKLTSDGALTIDMMAGHENPKIFFNDELVAVLNIQINYLFLK